MGDIFKDDTWYQKAWRPINGFAVAAGSFVGTVAVCLLALQALYLHDTAALNVIPQLASSIALILAVPGAAVGIAAWHKGAAQVQEVKNEGKV